MSNIPINSGTGPGIAVDPIGSDSYQIVKIMQAASGATGTLSSTIVVTGTVGALMLQKLDNLNDTILVYGLQTGSAINQAIAVSTTGGLYIASGGGGGTQYGAGSTLPGTTGTGTLAMGMQSGSTAAQVILVSTTGGLYIASGGGGGAQYQAATTGMGSTGTGTLFLGMQTGSTAAQTIAVSTTGGLIIASMPAVGGGVQYSIGDTSMAATGTGTLILGLQSGATTSRALAMTTTGGIFNVQTVASITTLLGTVAVSGAGGGAQYTAATTGMGATGTGTLFLGMQSGSTAAQTIAVTTTGAQYVLFTTTAAVTAANVTIASMTTGTCNVVNVLSASGVTIASIATGTLNVINTVAISGSASVINTVAISGSASIINTPNIVLTTTTKGAAGAIVSTVHASQFQAFVVATTSAAGGVIVKTSGANTLYITDVLVSVQTPMNVLLCSETTTMAGPIYLSANGGWVENCVQPYVCNSAQSLRVILSSSGSCQVHVRGYTVT